MNKTKFIPFLLLPSFAVSIVAFKGVSTYTSLKAEDDITYLTRAYNSSSDIDKAVDTSLKEISNIKVANWDEGVGIQPTSLTSEYNYLIYEIKTVDSSNIFSNLTATLSDGRFASYFGSPIYLEFYLNTAIDGITSHMVERKIASNGSRSDTVSCDLTNKAMELSASTLYFAINIRAEDLTSGMGSLDWVCFNKLTISGKEESASTDTHSYKVNDNWRATSSSSSYNATSISNIGCDANPVHGAIVGTWGDPVSVNDGDIGSITYKVGRPNQVITNLSLSGKFRFTNMGNPTMHDGDKILIEYSLDGSNYSILKRLCHNGTQSEDYDEVFEGSKEEGGTYSLNLDSLLYTDNRLEYVYIRFSMQHLLAVSAGLELWGMAAYETGVEYTTKKGTFIRYELNGGLLPSNSKYAFLKEDPIYTLPTPTRTGYTFDGWFDSNNVKYTTFDPSGESIYIEARWTQIANTYTITYENTYGAVNTNPEIIYKDGEDVTLSSISRSGYTFEGWYDALEGGNKITVIDASEVSGDIVLFAHWSESGYSITYSVAQHILLSVEGREDLPTSISYNTTYSYLVGISDTYYHIGDVKINGNIVELNEKGGFEIRGSELINYSIVITEYHLQNVITESTYNNNFTNYKTNETGWASKTYDFNNIQAIHDSDDAAGLGTINAGIGYLVYKFEAPADKSFESLSLSGLVRIFDLDNKDSEIKIYLSPDGNTYTLEKTLSRNPEQQIYTFDFDKELNELTEIYIKIEINRLGEPGYAKGWVLLQNISINLTLKDDGGGGDDPEPVDPDDPVTPIIDVVTPTDVSGKKAAWLISGIVAGCALLTVGGIFLVKFIFSKKRGNK